jgi:hypothetical protein
MAGSKHHILPRFLLKGFASKVIPRANRQDEVFVWAYRRGGKVFETKTTNVGFETHFYGKEGELNVDNEITAIEGEFAASLDKLRQQDDGFRVFDEKVLEFITHLTLRTKHLRDSIIDASGFFFDNVFGYFSDFENWKAYCVRHFKRHPEIIKDELEKVLQNAQVSAYKKAMMRQRVKKMPIDRIVELMDDDQSGLEFLFQSLRIQFTEGLNDIVKQSHIKSLLKNLVSEPRVERYQQLSWYIRKSNEPLILGDVGCLFEIDDDERYTSLGGTESDIKNVYLPLSSNCILIGTALPHVPQIDFGAINEAFAKCSRDYFVCSISSPNMARLSSMIGQESEMIPKEEIEKAIQEVIM